MTAGARSLLVVLALGASGCATTGSWREVRSAHFHLYTDLDSTRAAAASAHLETSLAAITQVELLPMPAKPFDVFVLATPGQPFTSEPASSGGWWSSRPVLLFDAGQVATRDGSRAPVLHQLAHLLHRETYFSQPPWLDEGLSVWLESLRFDDAANQLVEGGELPSAPPVIAVPLELLWADAPDRSPASFWVRFLRLEEPQRFAQWLKRLRAGDPARQAFDEVFAPVRAGLDARFAKTLARHRFPSKVYRLAPVPPPFQRPLGTGDGELVMAVAHQLTGRDADARAHLESSVASQPAPCAAKVALGSLQQTLTKANVERWLVEDPRCDAGWLALVHNEPQLAVYERAYRAQPDDTAIAFFYAWRLRELGLVYEALEVTRRWAVLDPTNHQWHLLDATLHAAAGQCAQAVSSQVKALALRSTDVEAQRLVDYRRGCLGPAAIEGHEGEWSEWLTPHVRLQTDLPENDARALVERLERAFTGLASALQLEAPAYRLRVIVPVARRGDPLRESKAAVTANGSDTGAEYATLVARLPPEHVLGPALAAYWPRLLAHSLKTVPAWLLDFASGPVSLDGESLTVGDTEAEPDAVALRELRGAEVPTTELASAQRWFSLLRLRHAEGLGRYLASLRAGELEGTAWQQAFGALPDSRLAAEATALDQSRGWQPVVQPTVKPASLTGRRLERAEAQAVFGQLQWFDADFLGAVATWGRALSIDSRQPQARLGLANTAFRGKQQLEKLLAVAEQTNLEEAWARVAVASQVMGVAEREALLQRVAARVPPDNETVGNEWLWFQLQHRPGNDVSKLVAALARRPLTSAGLDTLALAASKAGQPCEAARLERNALALNLHSALEAGFRKALAGSAAQCAATPAP